MGIAALAAVLAGAGAGFLGAKSLVAAYPFGTPAGRNHWSIETWAAPGNPLAAFVERAARAQVRPASLPGAQARTYVAARDGDGRAFSGASRYVLHVAPAVLLAAGAYWTIAALSDEGAIVEDGRPALASSSSDLQRNADGSLDIVVQATSPDDAAANWLAAPPDRFRLVLRVYAPLPNDGWWPPPVLRRESAA